MRYAYTCTFMVRKLEGRDHTEYSSSWEDNIATGYRLEAGVRFPLGARFSLLQSFQTRSETQPASFYPMSNGGDFPGDKATRA
jgi:hypothetical protein